MSALCPRRLAVIATLAGLTLAVVPAPALAATPHAMMLAPASIFSGLEHALLGAFSWTVGLASKFVLITLGALVKLLIPRSWASDGAQIMGWIVQVPNYAGKISTPGGGTSYGFAGINSLRELFMWLGMAIAPLTLTHATARAMVDESEPIAIPVLRVMGAAAGILIYPYLWAQAADLADQITQLILTLPSVTDGLQKLMDYAVDGAALGGWQLIDLGLMGAIGIELLGLIFMKVVVILLGALLYATGPLMIALVPTRFGHAIARAWLSAVMFLLGIGVAWGALFAVGAILIQDAGTAGPLLAGNSTFGHLVGGLILAVAGLAALWMCLKLTREAGGLLRMQLGGMLALGGLSASAPSAVGSRGRTTGASLRQFATRIGNAGAAAGGELAEQMPGGARMRTAMRGAAHVGRRGVAGTAAAHARDVAGRAAGPTAAILGRSRAGAVAVAMARSGTAAYRPTPTDPPSSNGSPGHGSDGASNGRTASAGASQRGPVSRAARGARGRADTDRVSPTVGAGNTSAQRNRRGQTRGGGQANGSTQTGGGGRSPEGERTTPTGSPQRPAGRDRTPIGGGQRSTTERNHDGRSGPMSSAIPPNASSSPGQPGPTGAETRTGSGPRRAAPLPARGAQPTTTRKPRPSGAAGTTPRTGGAKHPAQTPARAAKISRAPARPARTPVEPPESPGEGSRG
jgi:hypothetical protein